MSDRFARQYTQLDSPASFAETVTPADDAQLQAPSRYIFVGETGNIQVTMLGSNTEVLFKSVPAGTTLPIRVSQVWANNTTANSIVSLY